VNRRRKQQIRPITDIARHVTGYRKADTVTERSRPLRHDFGRKATLMPAVAGRAGCRDGVCACRLEGAGATWMMVGERAVCGLRIGGMRPLAAIGDADGRCSGLTGSACGESVMSALSLSWPAVTR